MKVLKWSDVMHILELHFEASQVADVALDLFDYAFEVENSEEGVKTACILGGVGNHMNV